MPTSNPWLTPFQRSFNAIRSKIITELRSRVPEVSDYSEGNIFILLISIISGIAEVIHYYIDNMARETFFVTARRYSSLYKHAKLVDYHVKAAFPASVDLTIFRSNGLPINTDIIIPVDTEFVSTDGKVWISTRSLTWFRGTYSLKIPVMQKQPIGNTGMIDLGTITSQDVLIYLGDLPTNTKYVEGSMVLTIDDIPWVLVTTFAYSSPNDRVYKVEVDQNRNPYITFGNGIFGMKPNLNGKVKGTFYITYGYLGNVPENSFISVPAIISQAQGDTSLRNLFSASGGTDYETFEMLKDHIPLSIKTLGVAITKDDFEAIARLVPGVDKAYCNYICGRYLEIYITPDNGGEASQALLDNTYLTLARSKVITTNITILSTHGARIFINVEVWGKPSFNRVDISNQIKRALIEAYNYNTSDINKPVRLSDIYALVDNQTMVDYIRLHKLYLLSYPQGKTASQPDLNITAFTQNRFDAVNDKDFERFTVLIVEGGYQIIEGNGTIHRGTYGNSLEVISSRASFNITIGTSSGLVYNIGDEYYLTIQPMNTDLLPQNYNIPIFSNDTITLDIHETV